MIIHLRTNHKQNKSQNTIILKRYKLNRFFTASLFWCSFHSISIFGLKRNLKAEPE